MFGRTGLMVLGLGAAVGVPYVATEWQKLKANFTGNSPANPPAAASHFGGTASPGYAQFGTPQLQPHSAHPTTTAIQQPLYPDQTQLETPPLVPMHDALRMNIAPSEIIARWPRVSAGLPQESLHGLRVPLITGTQSDDLAGALTYYFDAKQQCVKLTFSGTTGDPRRLMALAQQRFGFHRFASEEPGVERLQIRWNGKPHSELIVRPARVVRATSPLARYEVQIAVVDPASL